ncbi:MAG: hypothetical protein ABIP13_04955 [Tepidiformaceae bacterium]
MGTTTWQATVVAGGGAMKAGIPAAESGLKDGAALDALFDRPVGLAADSRGNIYVADSGNHVIRRLTPSGIVETVAGSGIEGSQDGLALEAQFRTPVAVAVSDDGTIYIIDSAAAQVRSLRDGQVRTVAGIDNAPCMLPPPKSPGLPPRPDNCLPYPSQPYRDGPGMLAVLGEPTSLAIGTSGALYVVDSANNAIRKIDQNGDVSLFAGTRVGGSKDGPAAQATFFFPVDIAAAPDGAMYVTEAGNRVRRIGPDGQVTTVAGAADGAEGFVDGSGFVARFRGPAGIAVGRDGDLFVVDGRNQRIRHIGPATDVTTIAGKGGQGFATGVGNATQFSAPTDIIVLPDGSVFVADYNLNRVFKLMKVTP